MKLAPALAAGLAMGVYSLFQVDPSAAAEGTYLALLSTAVLVTIGSLLTAHRHDWAWNVLPLLVAASVWVVPSGPGRGAATTALLTLGLAGAALARLRRGMDIARIVAAALGFQLLLRGQALIDLQLDLRALVICILLPVIGALATLGLASRYGTRPAILGASLVLILGPGWTLTGVLTLLVMALATELVSPRLAWPTSLRWSVAVGSALLLLAWNAKRATLLILAAGALGGNARSVAAIGLAGIVLTFTAGSRPWGPAIGELAWTPLLVPLPLIRFLRSPWVLLGGVAVAVTAVRIVPHPHALLPAVVLMALTTEDTGKGDAQATLQATWTGTLLVGSTLLAAYPWLRPYPVSDALRLLGLDPTWWWALVVLATAALVGLAIGRPTNKALSGLRRLGLAPMGVSTGILTLALFLALPGPALVLLDWPQVALDPARPSWTAQLPQDRERPTTTMVVDSALSHAASLPAGTPVATVRLRLKDGERREWTLRAGRETGEWAAARLDPAQRGATQIPNAWLSWIHHSGQPDGGTATLGQRYRARWSLEPPGVVEQLEVLRDPGLPTPVTLTLFHIGLRSSRWGRPRP